MKLEKLIMLLHEASLPNTDHTTAKKNVAKIVNAALLDEQNDLAVNLFSMLKNTPSHLNTLEVCLHAANALNMLVTRDQVEKCIRELGQK